MKPTSAKRMQLLKKVERVEARLNSQQTQRIEYAASIKGTSLSDFIIGSADAAAARAIQEHEAWTLTGKDREVFVNAFLHTPEPSQRMKAAATRYKKRVGLSS
jgi:uncharacterized protein (DUF1778 family)